MHIKLFTPGHAFFMDSLIMYSIISTLPPDVKYSVSSNAGFFEIRIEDGDLHDIATLIASNVEDHKESIVEYLIGQLKLIQKGSQKRLESYLSKHTDPDVVAESLARNYKLPGHAQREGRHYKGQHVWLPFYPHIGKYFTGEYKYQQSNYGVCSTCITLSALGFYKATVPLRSTPPENALNLVLLSFEGEVSGEILADILAHIKGDVFTKAIERLQSHSVANILPLNTFTYILLTWFTKDILRYLYESKAVWTVLSIKFDIVKGQVLQIRGYEEIPINRYISSLVYLIKIDEKFKLDPLERLQSITESLMAKKEPAPIESLYRYINTRSFSDLYTTTRQIVKVLKAGFGKNFCKELACLTQLI
ncbi:MAG: hypothetical protein RMJ31_06570 [Nitrososphaerota archaeon]|nr:hypothetical protein [Nitrososphaerales archaeon]MDW8045417.1 hypothetical protein [Nitrososphaerota archaeon]